MFLSRGRSFDSHFPYNSLTDSSRVKGYIHWTPILKINSVFSNAHHVDENGTFALSGLIPLNEVDRQRFPLVRVHGVCPGLADGVKEVVLHAVKGNIDLGVLDLTAPNTVKMSQ
jgi:hypothetical protein